LVPVITSVTHCSPLSFNTEYGAVKNSKFRIHSDDVWPWKTTSAPHPYLPKKLLLFTLQGSRVQGIVGWNLNVEQKVYIFLSIQKYFKMFQTISKMFQTISKMFQTISKCSKQFPKCSKTISKMFQTITKCSKQFNIDGRTIRYWCAALMIERTPTGKLSQVDPKLIFCYHFDLNIFLWTIWWQVDTKLIFGNIFDIKLSTNWSQKII
jgi:hypothetical protein